MFGNSRLIASHIQSEALWYQTIGSLSEHAVVIIPVRSLDSWLISAMLYVAVTRKQCLEEPMCSGEEHSCVINFEILCQMLEKRPWELSLHSGLAFAALAKLKHDGLLRPRVYLLDLRQLTLLHSVIASQLCPAVSSRPENVAAEKDGLYDECANGLQVTCCIELEPHHAVKPVTQQKLRNGRRADRRKYQREIHKRRDQTRKCLAYMFPLKVPNPHIIGWKAVDAQSAPCCRGFFFLPSAHWLHLLRGVLPHAE